MSFGSPHFALRRASPKPTWPLSLPHVGSPGARSGSVPLLLRKARQRHSANLLTGVQCSYRYDPHRARLELPIVLRAPERKRVETLRRSHLTGPTRPAAHRGSPLPPAMCFPDEILSDYIAQDQLLYLLAPVS